MNSYEFARILDLLDTSTMDDEQVKNLVLDLYFHTNFYDIANGRGKKKK